MSRTVAVIGGGVAGLSAAFAASEKGVSVTLFEMAPFLGGRAAGETGFDTGRHLVTTAYREFLWLLDRIGSRRALALMPQCYGAVDGMRMPFWRINGPLGAAAGLLGSSLLPLKDRTKALIALKQTLDAAPAEPTDSELAGNPGDIFPITPGPALSERLTELKWPASLYDRIGEPLAIGMMNGRPETVSHAPFMTALKRMLNDPVKKAGWVRGDWGALISGPAQKALEQQGIRILTQTRVSSVRRSRGGWTVAVDSSRERFDTVVAALPFHSLHPLSSCKEAKELVSLGETVSGNTIMTMRGRFTDAEALPGPLAEEGHARAIWFVEPHPKGGVLIERVVSGLSKDLWPDPKEVEADFLRRTKTLFSAEQVVESHVRWYPLATPTLTPGTQRPHLHIAEGLYYASDGSATGLPGTLESAARAGRLAGTLAATLPM
ncbi:MAG: FAD-dependent oxidoreductase [bacterium]